MSNISLKKIVAPSGGLQVSNGPLIKDTAQEISGRFYLNANWIPASQWNYLPGSSMGLATDVPPCINSVLQATNSATQLTLNTSNGLLYFPKAGKVTINAWSTLNGGASTTSSYELRICTYASPAWPAANQAAKTYGATAGNATALAGNGSAVLKQQNLVTIGSESGIEWSGIVQVGTQIAVMMYCSTANQPFGAYCIYVDASYDYFLSP